MIRQNQFTHDDGGDDLVQMPLALRIDLLVDGELSEAQRTALLRRLESGEAEVSAQWRDLALRFLQGQVEKETVRQLMAGGTLVPVDFAGATAGRRLKFPAIRWMHSNMARATAAGLLIAATSALMTVFAMHEKNGPRDVAVSARDTAFFTGTVPGVAAGYSTSIPVTVPLVPTGPDAAMNLFPAGFNPAGGVNKTQWRSVVIQKDASGNAVVIPVNAMQVRVY